MTYSINAVTRRAVLSGSAGTGPYAFTFEILDDDDIQVYKDTTLLTKTTDYTVTINTNGTGSVTLNTGTTNVPSAPTASNTITVIGSRDIERTTDFVTAGDLKASSLNEQLDSLTIFDQQVAEEQKRSLQAPVFDPAHVDDGGTLDMTLPVKATRANKYLAFDSNGNPTVLAGTADPLSSVDTAQLVDGAVTSPKLGSLSVSTSAIQNDSITADKIADDAVVQAAIADNAIGTNQIANSAVTAAKLSPDASFVSGMVMPFAGTSAPTGWLLAYGQAVSRSTYSSLFAAISTTYGNGDGSSTFNLPDLRGRVAAGKDNMGGSAASRITSSQSNSDDAITGATLGDTGGDEVQDLQETHLPAHTHAVNSVTVYAQSLSGSGALVNASGPDLAQGSGFSGHSQVATTGVTITNGNNGQVTSASHTASLANTGSGTAVNNIQPTIILNYIIKT